MDDVRRKCRVLACYHGYGYDCFSPVPTGKQQAVGVNRHAERKVVAYYSPQGKRGKIIKNLLFPSFFTLLYTLISWLKILEN